MFKKINLIIELLEYIIFFLGVKNKKIKIKYDKKQNNNKTKRKNDRDNKEVLQ